MSDVRNKPCMTHYPDFDHYCASKGQGCKYYEPVCPKCSSNEWGFSSIFGVFDCHECGHEWHIEENEREQRFTGQTDKFEQSFKKIFINEEEK